MNSDRNVKLIETVRVAEKKLTLKVAAFSEAYIFVLEATNQSLQNLKELSVSDTDYDKEALDPKTIHASFVRLSSLLHGYGVGTEEYFRSILFIDLMSSMEQFFADLVKAVIVEYPQKIGRIKFELKDVLRAADTDELVLQASEQFVYGLMYEKPEDYLRSMCSALSIDVEPFQAYWPMYIEAKARRDLGVHNNWVCNQTYIRKVSSVMGPLNVMEGERLLPKDRDYCSNVSMNILRIAQEMSSAVVNKHS